LLNLRQTTNNVHTLGPRCHWLERPGNKEIQLDLFLDCESNVKLYPKFQEYFREAKPPLLAIWGRNDPFFIPAGAEAYRKDLPNAQIRLLDTGHCAIETHGMEIAAAMKDFLAVNDVAARRENEARLCQLRIAL
jgi:pimeloyl-ACP methyl ester carboxylesterase